MLRSDYCGSNIYEAIRGTARSTFGFTTQLLWLLIVLFTFAKGRKNWPQNFFFLNMELVSNVTHIHFVVTVDTLCLLCAVLKNHIFGFGSLHETKEETVDLIYGASIDQSVGTHTLGNRRLYI